MTTRKARLIAGIFLAVALWSAAYTNATDEITVGASLQVINGQFSLLRSTTGYKVTQLTNAVDYGIQLIATDSTNSLNIANVQNPHYAYFRNLSTNRTIFVTMTMKMEAGDVAVVPISSTNMTAYVEANTNAATELLEYWINAK
jgi:hypothetical protein